MVLILSHSQDVTADYLASKLESSKINFIRLDSDKVDGNIRVSFKELNPILFINQREVRAADISHVWFRRPKPIEIEGVKDQAEKEHISLEWAESIEGFLAHIPIEKWVNHPSKNVIASHKFEQLSRAYNFGLSIPDTLVTQSPEDAELFWKKHGGEVIVKPVAGGFLDRGAGENSQIFTSKVSQEDLSRGKILLKKCPTLFQERIDKTFDVRITIIDKRIFAVSLINPVTPLNSDIRRDNMVDVQYSPVNLPREVEDALIRLLKSYSLRFAAVDMIVDKENRWFFLEINPNGQWAWLDLINATNICDGFIDSFGRIDE